MSPDTNRRAVPAGRHIELANELSAEIRSTAYPVGSRFPTEPELQRRFNVGRHTIREALKILTEQGLIGRRRKTGTVVLSKAPVSPYVHSLRDIKGLLDFANSTVLDIRHEGFASLSLRNSGDFSGVEERRWFRIAGLRATRGASGPSTRSSWPSSGSGSNMSSRTSRRRAYPRNSPPCSSRRRTGRRCWSSGATWHIRARPSRSRTISTRRIATRSTASSGSEPDRGPTSGLRQPIEEKADGPAASPPPLPFRQAEIRIPVRAEMSLNRLSSAVTMARVVVAVFGPVQASMPAAMNLERTVSS